MPGFGGPEIRIEKTCPQLLNRCIISYEPWMCVNLGFIKPGLKIIGGSATNSGILLLER